LHGDFLKLIVLGLIALGLIFLGESGYSHGTPIFYALRPPCRKGIPVISKPQTTGRQGLRVSANVQ